MTDQPDIVEWLRDTWGDETALAVKCLEAANEIERLRRVLRQARLGFANELREMRDGGPVNPAVDAMIFNARIARMESNIAQIDAALNKAGG